MRALVASKKAELEQPRRQSGQQCERLRREITMVSGDMRIVETEVRTLQQ